LALRARVRARYGVLVVGEERYRDFRQKYARATSHKLKPSGVIYTTRKFLECDNDYRPNWTAEARDFFASCYDRVQKRMWRTNLIDVEGEEEQEAHALLKLCQSTHNGQWKRNYTIT
jgi:hypothetical protein